MLCRSKVLAAAWQRAILIYRVRVRFRPYRTVGAEASRKQTWAALRTSTAERLVTRSSPLRSAEAAA
jgi:hypothetical protein